jgi:hypothetical protein
MVNWAQQAHIPSFNTSSALIYTQYRDAGEGVLEVDTILYNFADPGGDTLDRINTPWSAIRDTTYAAHYLSDAQGAAEEREGRFATNAPTPLRRTNGWSVFTTSNRSSSSSALALVFGNAPSGLYRYGVGGAASLHQFVATAITTVDVPPGRTFFYRYYLVVGPYRRVLEKAVALAKDAGPAPLSFDPSRTPVLSWDISSTGGGVRHAGARTPALCTYAYPVSNSRPVFVLKNSRSGATKLSTNPYAVSPSSIYEGKQVYYPYEASTVYQGILGFVPRDAPAIGACSTRLP